MLNLFFLLVTSVAGATDLPICPTVFNSLVAPSKFEVWRQVHQTEQGKNQIKYFAIVPDPIELPGLKETFFAAAEIELPVTGEFKLVLASRLKTGDIYLRPMGALASFQKDMAENDKQNVLRELQEKFPNVEFILPKTSKAKFILFNALDLDNLSAVLRVLSNAPYVRFVELSDPNYTIDPSRVITQERIF